ncbi:MAG TPA: Lrp/AsnC family transcriptional regulator [Candidatus Woesearchaeota archaeon]|nr:Lrp/AsnC family transcriptional regulator [Candidatus Woesearchaeota archaeon]
MVNAFVFVVLKEGGAEIIDINRVKNIEGVKSALSVYGSYDLVVEIKVKDVSDLQKVIKKLRSFNEIVKTTTMICIE